jgi:thioredoxin-related protein
MIFKYFSFSALFVVLVASVAYNFKKATDTSELPSSTKAAINWVSLEEAEKLVKENPKKIFVDVYTNWCGWCKVMDRTTFSDPEIIEYVNENYYAVKLNAEDNAPIKFMGKTYTGPEITRAFKVTGFPTIVFLDEKLNYQPVPGYQKPKPFMNILQKFNGAA